MADDEYIDTKSMLVTPVSVVLISTKWDSKEQDCLAYEYEIAKDGFEKDSTITSKNGIEVYDQNSNQNIKFLFFQVNPMVIYEEEESTTAV
jgi:hypothetical protein